MWRVLLLLMLVSAVVESDDGSLDLHVNRMYIYGVMLSPGLPYKSIEYQYADGDTVDVQCTRSDHHCTLKLHYEFDEQNIGGNGTLTGTFEDPQYDIIGLRTTLRAAHDGKTITCSCTDQIRRYWIKMTLVNTVFDGIINLKLDGKTLRYQQRYNKLQPFSYMDAYAQEESYWVFSNAKPRENIEFEWSTSEDNITLQTYAYEQTLMMTKTTLTPTEFVVAAGYNTKYHCLARNTSLQTVVRHVSVDFLQDISQHVTDATPLTVNISHSLLETYELAGDQLIYYHYEDGEVLTLNCSTLAGVITRYNHTLVFGDTVARADSIIKHIQLNDLYENKTVECSLLRNLHTIRNIRILFRMKDTVHPSVTGVDIMNITSGAEVTIQCQVTGKPQPSISWQFMSEDASSFVDIPGSARELRLASVREQHAGRYRCIASNVLATDDHVTTLIVQGQDGAHWLPAVLSVSCVVCGCVVAALYYVLITRTRRAKSRSPVMGLTTKMQQQQ